MNSKYWQESRLKCQNWNRKKAGDSKTERDIPIDHGSAKNNLGDSAALIEVIAVNFLHHQRLKVNLNYAGRFLRLNIQRKGGVLFMCVYIAEHFIEGCY